MSGDGTKLLHAEITDKVIRCFYEVFNELGPGFLESVYEAAMVIALRQAGLTVQRQAPIDVHFRGELVGEFRADLMVEGLVLCELKVATQIASAHEGQTLHYLRATTIEVALILNFGPKPEFRRMVLRNERKRSASPTPASSPPSGLPGPSPIPSPV